MKYCANILLFRASIPEKNPKKKGGIKMKRFVILALIIVALFAMMQSAQASRFAGKSVRKYWLPIAKQCGASPQALKEITVFLTTQEAKEQMALIAYTNSDTLQRKWRAGDPNREFWSGSNDPRIDAFAQLLSNYFAQYNIWPVDALS